VRFEMPFAVWCTNCKPDEVLIGQGVRFNAEKKRVGHHYSTPVFSFRMKHTLCGGWIEIRTDPKNTAYIVTEGGRRRDTGEDQIDEIRIRLGGGDTEKDQDAFARIEGKTEDKRQFDAARSRILELQKRQNRDWEDPYEQSKRLRRTFRTERKTLENAQQSTEALKDKMSLGIELLDETEEDRTRAKLVDFGASVDDPSRAGRARPMFEPSQMRMPPPSTSVSLSLTSHKDRRKRRREQFQADTVKPRTLLESELRGNMRAMLDPFLNGGKAWQPESIWRRKIPGPDFPEEGEDQMTRSDACASAPTPPLQGKMLTEERTTAVLVDYGSDSD
jgi:coiled-coil domain-containing protein 130